jgi:hypothetical protein
MTNCDLVSKVGASPVRFNALYGRGLVVKYTQQFEVRELIAPGLRKA